MVIKCKCGISYNTVTVQHCPLCDYHEDKEERLSREIEIFLRQDTMNKARLIRSLRASGLSIWSTQHLKDRKEFHEK